MNCIREGALCALVAATSTDTTRRVKQPELRLLSGRRRIVDVGWPVLG